MHVDGSPDVTHNYTTEAGHGPHISFGSALATLAAPSPGAITARIRRAVPYPSCSVKLCGLETLNEQAHKTSARESIHPATANRKPSLAYTFPVS